MMKISPRADLRKDSVLWDFSLPHYDLRMWYMIALVKCKERGGFSDRKGCLKSKYFCFTKTIPNLFLNIKII